jgi:catechol 2,3-dioxygenase-like lactoylglutathione lyase family enzyme
MKDEKQQFNVYLLPDTIKQMKHLSVDEQISLSDLVEKVLTTYITQKSSTLDEEKQDTQKSTAGQHKAKPHATETTEKQEAAKITLQPMLHVNNMGKSLDFYEQLGATVLNGSRDDDWVLLRFGETELGLLAHPENPEQHEGKVELNFEYEASLEKLEEKLRKAGVRIARPAGDEGFGEQLQLESPDGLLVKINQLDPDLYA